MEKHSTSNRLAVDQPTRGADRNRSLADQADPATDEMLLPSLDDGITLSRLPDVDYQQLASRLTYLSYGCVGHSPARYDVSGRAIIDESNTFFYRETNLDGVLDLVSRSKKPVQKLAWASIDNVLTAIQICEAHDRGVLVPWNSWRHEFFQADGNTPRRRPWRVHFRTRGQSSRGCPRTRLLKSVSKHHLHAKRVTGRDSV